MSDATLPPAAVQALDDAGLLALKLPAVLGGAEADLVTQLEVLEAVTYIDTSAGWCTLIGAAAIAALGAFLADEAPTWAGTPARRHLLRCAPPDVLLRDRPPFLEVRVVLEARDRTERPL